MIFIKTDTTNFIAFVDFSKAFYSVNHEALWEVLEARGIHPKLISKPHQGPLG